MIWPKDAYSSFVIGEADEKTGKVIREWIIRPGEEIPEEALKLFRESCDVTELHHDKPPFKDGYDRSIAEELLRRGGKNERY